MLTLPSQLMASLLLSNKKAHLSNVNCTLTQTCSIFFVCLRVFVPLRSPETQPRYENGSGHFVGK